MSLLTKILTAPLALLPAGCAEKPPPDRPHPDDDTDEDVVPDSYDRCEGDFRTRDGCPNPSVTDSDGDGVPDDHDACPDEHHLTLDGCGTKVTEDNGLPPSDSPPVTEGPVPFAEFYIERQEGPTCPHLAVSKDGSGAIMWQEGAHILSAQFSPDVTEVKSIAEAEEPLVGLCNVKRAVDLSSKSFLVPMVSDGNYVTLKLVFPGADTAVDIASFPMPRLGPRRNYYLASMAGFSDGRTVTVWTDRDKVVASVFSAQGEILTPPFIVNRRELMVLNVINPDVAVTGDDTFDVVWQEGDGENGPIMSAKMNSSGEKLRDDFSISQGVEGRWPVIGYANGPSTVAWVSAADNAGHIKTADGEFLFGQGVMAPELVINNSGRMVFSWLHGVENGAARVHIAWPHSDGAVIGETSPEEKSALAAAGNIIVAAYSTIYPRSAIAMRFYRWGNE